VVPAAKSPSGSGFTINQIGGIMRHAPPPPHRISCRRCVALRVDALELAGLTERIRIIPHAPHGIPDCGSFEVWFADGRPSEYFYWDDNPGRASITRKPNSEEAETALLRPRLVRSLINVNHIVVP
jgi:hypothetical protein